MNGRLCVYRGGGYEGSHNNDSREIRDVSFKVIRKGRAKNMHGAKNRDCICDDIFIRPSGDVFHCACKKSHSYGNINHPNFATTYTVLGNSGNCWFSECNKEYR